MGYETEIINEKECGCHTIKKSHDFLMILAMMKLIAQFMKHLIMI